MPSLISLTEIVAGFESPWASGTLAAIATNVPVASAPGRASEFRTGPSVARPGGGGHAL